MGHRTARAAHAGREHPYEKGLLHQPPLCRQKQGREQLIP